MFRKGAIRVSSCSNRPDFSRVGQGEVGHGWVRLPGLGENRSIGCSKSPFPGAVHHGLVGGIWKSVCLEERVGWGAWVRTGPQVGWVRFTPLRELIYFISCGVHILFGWGEDKLIRGKPFGAKGQKRCDGGCFGGWWVLEYGWGGVSGGARPARLHRSKGNRSSKEGFLLWGLRVRAVRLAPRSPSRWNINGFFIRR